MKTLLNKGVFKLYTEREGKEVLLGQTDNMVVDKGLDLICLKDNGLVIAKCVLSADSSLITADTTQIPSAIAISNNRISTEYGAKETAPYYYWYKTTFQFEANQAVGNLNKIGITDDNNNIFSVAAFRDPEGNPTTIQLMESERLRVIYEYRVYVETSDVVLNNVKLFTNNDNGYKITIRPASITDHSVARWLCNGLHMTSAYDYNGNNIIGFRGAIAGIKSAPVDQLFVKRDAFSSPSYQPGSLVKYFNVNFGYEEFNSTNGISSLLIATSRGCFQIGIDPPLVKNSQQLMSISIPITVSR